MSRVKDHIHRLKRTTYSSGTKVYFCTNDCSYKIEVAFALGKVVECPSCYQPFQMNEYSIKLAKPHCNNCGKIQKKDPETGKRKFVAKGRQLEALKDLAASNTNSLKDRLSKIVVMEKDEDL